MQPQHDDVSPKAFSKNVFETLYYIYKPYRFQLVIYIIFGFLGRMLLLSNANFIGYWVDSMCLIPENCKPVPAFFNSWTSQDFILTLTTITGIGFIITSIFRVGLSRISSHAVTMLYDEVTVRTSRQPMSFFDSTPLGRIITRFSSDYGNVFRMFGGPLSEFLSIIFDLVAMTILILIASPYYLVIVLFIGISNYSIYKRVQINLRVLRRDLSAKRAPSVAHFAETAQGATSIRLFNKMPSFSERFKTLDTLFLNQRFLLFKSITLFSIKMSFTTLVLIMAIGASAYFLIQNHILSVGSVGVAFGFISLSSYLVQMFFDWFAQFEEAMVGVERLDQYLRRPTEKGSLIPFWTQIPTNHLKSLTPNHVPMKIKKPTLHFENLSFNYYPNGPMILKNINLSIKHGTKIGIIGKTGSGKSSLIQALLYLYPFSSGKILLNDQSPELDSPQSENTLSLKDYREHFAMISQDPFILKGSIRENLDLKKAYTDDEIFRVLNNVGLSDWIQEQPQSLETQIEERGKNLSQGEKQLLCLARGLLQEAPIIIMDEATSSVDPQSEEIMVKASDEFFKGRTQIIIAHRLSTLKKCDLILWLENGQIKSMDTPKVILKEFHSEDLQFL